MNDISYYVGDRTPLAPQGSPIANLDQVPPPDFAIEIADSSINDDLGKKRLLYEEMRVAEYWVVDVESTQILAFQIVGRWQCANYVIASPSRFRNFRVE